VIFLEVMKGSLTTILVGAFGLLAFAWGRTVAVAVPIGQVAQARAADGISRPLLKAGSQGAAVLELQAALKLLGYYTGAVDGVYSESTVIAVSQFQQAAGLKPDGIVNSATWERLFPLVPTTASSAAAFPVPAVTKTTPAVPNSSVPNNTRVTNPKPTPASGSRAPTRSASTSVNLPTLRLGMQGSTVKRLQQRLQAIGLFKGSVDGVFGSQTETAVKAVQRRYRLKADGVVGTATWKVLDRQPPRTR